MSFFRLLADADSPAYRILTRSPQDFRPAPGLWEVAELENGVVKKNEDIYDNLTYAEAQQIAGMWTKKKEDAGV